MELFGNFCYDEESTFYNFNVTRVVNWKAADEVLRIVGEHLEENFNENVESVTFSSLRMNRFPRGIGGFFPNLKVLTIINCGIKRITKNDLMGLGNLQELVMDGNEITTLPSGLFDEIPAIDTISLSDNKIKVELIDAYILDSLHNLNFINFNGNINIDGIYTNNEDYQQEVHEYFYYHPEGY